MFKQIMMFALAAVAAVSRAVSGAFARVAAVVGAGAVALTTSTPTLAAPVDLTGLTSSIDFSTAIAAILLAGAAVMAVYITIKATMFVIGMVKRG